MHVLCKSTKGHAETRCCVCGQGFVMFWDRQSHAERAAALPEIQETLRRHHRTTKGPEAHPTQLFPVPEWDPASAYTAAVGSGTVPNLEL